MCTKLKLHFKRTYKSVMEANITAKFSENYLKTTWKKSNICTKKGITLFCSKIRNNGKCKY